MTSNARIKMLRITPRKVRVVAKELRGKDIQAVVDYLTFCRKRAARPLLKLIKSAIANADQKGGMDLDNLYVKELLVDKGPTMKRWMPRARGMATPLLKRSSRISVTLDVRQ
ncbi:MAG: 50S ribosomal protein L22 [Deltaproteobacteria bacterium]|nr:50S ribosomal protein L22 [Deltaproteobacteria bacterium]